MRNCSKCIKQELIMGQPEYTSDLPVIKAFICGVNGKEIDKENKPLDYAPEWCPLDKREGVL